MGISRFHSLYGQAFSSIFPFPHPLPTHFFEVNIAANFNMAANLRSRALKKNACTAGYVKRSYQSKIIKFFFGRLGCGWVGRDTEGIFLFEIKYVMFL